MGDEFEAHRARLLDLLRRLAWERREVTLASGRRSDFYIDCKQAVLTAEGHFLVGWLVCDLVAREAPEVTAVGGLTMGADPIASATATMSFVRGRPLDAFYVRKEPKGHGTQRWIEGDRCVVPGSRVAVVEDVVTTGGSTLKAIERARLHGLEVRRVVALVDREEDGGREAVEREAPLSSLFRRSDFG
ncbi:MAG: orotate phosphoribosyltransferase [Myxococcales bacterium]|nr:orotate phosphoribosyltransferase [Myxococcales bacterium]